MSNINDFVIENGVLKEYHGPGGDVVVPDGVTKIWYSVFCNNKTITSITIPKSVTDIGAGVFRGCTGLADENGFIIVGNVLYCYQGSDKDIIIPDGVVKIAESAFFGCQSMLTLVIPDSVTSIGKKAFYWCESLTSVVLPAGITTIEPECFGSCSKLSKVTLPAGLITIGREAFFGCFALEHVTLPEGLQSIDTEAFELSGLKNVKIPASVVSIGSKAFSSTHLKKITIPSGVERIAPATFASCGDLKEVTILDGPKIIGDSAFSYCTELERVSIPGSVSRIGERAFEVCNNLRSIGTVSPTCELHSDAFGGYISETLAGEVSKLYPFFTDGGLKKYVICKEIWFKLSPELQTEIFLTHQGKSLQSAYKACISTKKHAEKMGEHMIAAISAEASPNTCTAVAKFMILCCDFAEESLLKTLYAKLQGQKNAKKAIKTIENHIPLATKLGAATTVDDLVSDSLPDAENAIMRALVKNGQSAKDVEKKLRNFYGITFKDLPKICYTDGISVAPVVFAHLLTLHEKQEKVRYDYYDYHTDVVAEYKEPGLCPEAQTLMEQIDRASLQQALRALADTNLGLVGRSKRMFLAYPICRYADDALMEELTKRAPSWRSVVSKNDAPPLASFRKANRYNNSRAAMLFADKYGELDRYAEIRGTNADTIRNRHLSDIGIDEAGGKAYDLGNQTVTVRLQKDLSFLVELPGGKTAKSLPKKGADEAKYAAANADFTQMKKDAKQIVKQRRAVLFEQFLDGKGQNAQVWTDGYLNNPLLRTVAKLLVWKQGAKTFTLGENGLITADSKEYTVGSGPIKVAHPIEMKPKDIIAWQKYFTANALKQPFAQIWEPAVDPAAIKPDRYKGQQISVFRTMHMEPHGITFHDEEFHNSIWFDTEECNLEHERTTYHRHEIAKDETFTLGKFTFKKYSRRVNHIVSLFDKWTNMGRIMDDDVNVVNLIGGATVAQVTEYISLAVEHKCANVSAALIEYKNTHFAEFDPMEEFVLE